MTQEKNSTDTTRPTMQETVFIAHYTDKDSDTFGNGTRSALQAYNCKNSQTAGAIAADVLKRPRVRHYIDRKLEALGYGEQVRLSILSDIGTGRYRKRTEQVRYDADGTVKDKIVTESTPGADSIIKVNDLLNKLTGRYETAKQASRIMSKSMQRMVDAITSQATGKQPDSKIKQVKQVPEQGETVGRVD